MRILAMQYTLQHKSLDIYLSGCKGVNGVHCKNCHNPYSWSFDNGTEYNKDYLSQLDNKVKTFSNMIDNIFVLGGEPNDNNLEELQELLLDLKLLGKKIWLFTRYDIDEVPLFELALCDYIKTGKYIPELTADDYVVHGIKLATTNQFIYMKGFDY